MSALRHFGAQFVLWQNQRNNFEASFSRYDDNFTIISIMMEMKLSGIFNTNLFLNSALFWI